MPLLLLSNMTTKEILRAIEDAHPEIPHEFFDTVDERLDLADDHESCEGCVDSYTHEEVCDELEEKRQMLDEIKDKVAECAIDVEDRKGGSGFNNYMRAETEEETLTRLIAMHKHDEALA